MSTPPFLLGVALMFWSWQAGWLWLGALAAVAIEVPRFARSRLHFAQADLDRIWNLCFVLFFGAFVVAFVTSDGASALATIADNNSIANRIEALNKSGRSVILVLLWLPLIFLPIAIAQAFSVEQRMDWSTFSWWLRRQRAKEVPRSNTPSGRGINVAWPYFALCLLATSAANIRTWHFPAGIAALAAWALAAQRTKHVHFAAWAACLISALALAFAAQIGLRQMQGWVQRMESTLIAKLISGRGFEPRENRTALGSIGRMKLSAAIVLRVEASNAPPALLREAVYQRFISPASWIAPQQLNFKDVQSELDLTTWKLLPDKLNSPQVTVSGFLSGGAGLLPVPLGVTRIEDFPAITLATNALGTMKVTEGPGFYRVLLSHDEGRSIDGAPEPLDLDVPNIEKPVIFETAERLGLTNQPPTEVLRKLAQFFAADFSYTLWQGEPRRGRGNETPLQRFLTETHAGHCEHFATATTLLLRAARIPARYVVGHSVQERRGSEWIVRERHAHSWSLAWFGGAWREIDNTPASWAALESTRPNDWQSLSDWWSDMWFTFSRWRWGKGEWKEYLIWLVVPLMLLATWRMLAQKQWNRARVARGKAASAVRPGADSEYYLIEANLAARGLQREPHETPAAWFARLRRVDPGLATALPAVLALHYRMRFDPDGIDGETRETLRRVVKDWLARNGVSNPRQA